MAAAKAKQQKNSDEITVTLAHPLSAYYAQRLGLDNKDYAVEDDVKVRRDIGQTLIQAGYVAGVEPGNLEQVHEALGLSGEPVLDEPTPVNPGK